MQNLRSLKNTVKIDGVKMLNKTVEQLKKEIRGAELVANIRSEEKSKEILKGYRTDGK